MKLLLLLSLVVLTLAEDAFVPEKITESNDVSQQTTADLQSQPNVQESGGDKKISKRSYGWSPWSYVGGYGWPWYGFGGYGLYGGWYPGWPLYYGHGYGGYSKYGYGGYIGYRGYGHGGWYKGW